MEQQLLKLAIWLDKLDHESSLSIKKLAARYDKKPMSTPPQSQSAFKYLMYLKLMRGLDDKSFHYFKRKYMNTSDDIQKECEEEFKKVLLQDTLRYKMLSSDLIKIFYERLHSVNWQSWFN